MAFGRLRKLWEKIKGGAKKAFGWVKDKILPTAKVAAPIVGGIFGGPVGAMAGSNIVGGVENGIGTLFPSLKGGGLKGGGINPKFGDENGLAWRG
jgi:hypothetical protein